MIKVDDKTTVIEGTGLDVINNFGNVVTGVYQSMAEAIGGECAEHMIKDLVEEAIRVAQKESGNKVKKEREFDPNNLVSNLLAVVLLGGVRHDAD